MSESECYSGVIIEPDGSASIWWRHSNQRRADYIKNMTLEEAREFALNILKSVEKLENKDD